MKKFSSVFRGKTRQESPNDQAANWKRTEVELNRTDTLAPKSTNWPKDLSESVRRKPAFYSAFTRNSIDCVSVGLLWLIVKIVVFGIVGVVAIASAVIGWLTLVGSWLSYRAKCNNSTIRKQRSHQAGG
jgi:hypothetical protein